MVPNPIYDQAAGPEYETIVQTSPRMTETNLDNNNKVTCRAPTTYHPSSNKSHRVLGDSDNYIEVSRFDSPMANGCQNYKRNGMPLPVLNQWPHEDENHEAIKT